MAAIMGALGGSNVGRDTDFGIAPNLGRYAPSSFGYGVQFGADNPAAVAAATLPASHPVNRALMRGLGTRPMMSMGARPMASPVHPAMMMQIPSASALAAVHPAVAAAAVQGDPNAIAAINNGTAPTATGDSMNTSNPNAMAAWNAQAQAVHGQSREALLQPNKYSSVKVERYGFAVNQALVLGTALSFIATNNPDVTIRPQRVTMNAPAPGFVTISELKLANTSVTVGGIQDAYDYGPNAVDAELDLPTLTPANRASVSGQYTSFTPPGYVGGTAYTFCVSMRGPATMDM
jgi:hypothetical protein